MPCGRDGRLLCISVAGMLAAPAAPLIFLSCRSCPSRPHCISGPAFGGWFLCSHVRNRDVLPFLTLTPTPSPPGATPAVLGEPGWGAVWTLSCGNAQSVLEAPIKRWHLHGREKARRGSRGCRQTGGHGDPWESEASFPAGTSVHTQVSLCTADPDARSGQGSPEPNTVWELRFPGWAGSQRGRGEGVGRQGQAGTCTSPSLRGRPPEHAAGPTDTLAQEVERLQGDPATAPARDTADVIQRA